MSSQAAIGDRALAIGVAEFNPAPAPVELDDARLIREVLQARAAALNATLRLYVGAVDADNFAALRAAVGWFAANHQNDPDARALGALAFIGHTMTEVALDDIVDNDDLGYFFDIRMHGANDASTVEYLRDCIRTFLALARPADAPAELTQHSAQLGRYEQAMLRVRNERTLNAKRLLPLLGSIELLEQQLREEQPIDVYRNTIAAMYRIVDSPNAELQLGLSAADAEVYRANIAPLNNYIIELERAFEMGLDVARQMIHDELNNLLVQYVEHSEVHRLELGELVDGVRSTMSLICNDLLGMLNARL